MLAARTLARMSEESTVVRRVRWWLAAAVIAGVVIGAGVGVWVAVRQDKAEPAAAVTSSPAPRLAFVSGAFRVPAGPKWTKGAACSRGSKYDDVHVGAQVTITDASGKVVAVADLTAGQVVDSATLPGMTTDCLLGFSASVPSGAGPYGFTLNRHGVVHFTESQLNVVELSLS